MKARIKATGEIVEVHTCDDADFVDRKGKFYWEHELFFGSLDTFPYEDPDYWTRLEHTYAGMAMQGMLATLYNPKYHKEHMACYTEVDAKEIARLSKVYAHALVEKMKEERK